MNDGMTTSPTAARKRAGHPGKIKDETGHRFGRLIVIGIAGRNSSEQVTWRCLCDCGIETIQAGATLRAGIVVSCGCYGAEARLSSVTKHGLSTSGPYQSYKELVRRCTSPQHIGWADYGGRGIKVCDEWATFEAFYADMGLSWKPKLTIERRDVNGPYSKANCYWATMTEQNNNKRNNVKIEHAAENLTSAQWARRANISLPLFRSRRKHGWTMDEILNTRPHQARTSIAATAP